VARANTLHLWSKLVKPIVAIIPKRIPPSQPEPAKKKPRKDMDFLPAAFRDLDPIRQAGGLYPFGWP
jgi:hypothetical protein